METSIIFLLICFVLIAIWGYYFGFVKPIADFEWLNRAGFIFATFIMIPFLVAVLWLQNGAIGRLAKTGIVPHPSIQETVGITVGVGKNPVWIFKIKASLEEITSFYRSEVNRPGWELTNDNPIMLILKRGQQKIVISYYKSWTSTTLIYKLTNKPYPTK